MKHSRLLFLFLILLISACSIGISSPNTMPAHPEKSKSETAYPINNLQSSESVNAYPQPTEIDILHPDKIEIPNPSANNGVVTGKILIQGTNEPYLNSFLILGEVSEADQPGFPPLVGYSLDSNPRAVQAKDGTFVFDKIKPGKYGIVLWSPLSTFLLSDPQTGETILVMVNAGKITDLGTIYIK